MRINWCDKHNLVGGAWCAMKDKAAGPCRMVPMRLIPEDAFNPVDLAEYTKEYLVVRGDGATLKCEWIPAALDGETP